MSKGIYDLCRKIAKDRKTRAFYGTEPSSPQKKSATMMKYYDERHQRSSLMWLAGSYSSGHNRFARMYKQNQGDWKSIIEEFTATGNLKKKVLTEYSMTTQEQAQYIIDHGIIIDTEATGLRETDQVIEICAIKASCGTVLLDTLVYNDGSDVEKEAMAVHGINVAMMITGQRVPAVAKILSDLRVSESAFITSYNIPFDERLLEQTTTAHELPKIVFDGVEHKTIDIMELANRHLVAKYGKWDHEQSKFSRMSLARCCEIAGIVYEGAAHRAKTDTKAALDLVRAIAEGRI